MSGVNGLRGYQLPPDASGGRQGELLVASMLVDIGRDDHVFGRLADFNTAYVHGRGPANRQREDYTPPYFWAGFVLFGDPGD